MAKKRLSGLDELMIVNPGIPIQREHARIGQIFLGEDGTLYQLESLGHFHTSRLGESEYMKNLCGHYFLGEDGTLYQAINL
jgi:hypothetical protein